MNDFRNTFKWYLAELTIVISGILIALALNAWWQGRIDRKSELELLGSLKSEFIENITELETRREFYKSRYGSALRLIELGPKAAKLSPESQDSIWRWVLRGGSYDPSMGVLNSATSSGTILLIRDAALRADLAAWPSLVYNVEDLEDRIMNLQFNHFIPWLRTDFSIPNGFGHLGMPPAQLNHQNTTIYSSVQLENFLRELVGWDWTLDDAIEALIEVTNRIMSKIDEGLQ